MFNRVYCKDNLELLKEIPDECIDLIYNDILYGTGKNFTYYKDLKADRKIIEDFYLPRFIEMKRVLKSNGSIFIQMDYRINHWIRCLLDDVFGYENLCNEIIWEYNSSPRKKKRFGNRHDTIYWYSKNGDPYMDENAAVVREPYSPTAPRGYEKEKYYHPLGKVVGDVWKINMLGQNDKTERTGYPTQKPEKLLERIVIACCPENGVVADFFCGSGTSLAVAKKNGRRFIGCDISEEAVKITMKRLTEIN